jgi:hypothetical protein
VIVQLAPGGQFALNLATRRNTSSRKTLIFRGSFGGSSPPPRTHLPLQFPVLADLRHPREAGLSAARPLPENVLRKGGTREGRAHESRSLPEDRLLDQARNHRDDVELELKTLPEILLAHDRILRAELELHREATDSRRLLDRQPDRDVPPVARRRPVIVGEGRFVPTCQACRGRDGGGSRCRSSTVGRRLP